MNLMLCIERLSTLSILIERMEIDMSLNRRQDACSMFFLCYVRMLEPECVEYLHIFYHVMNRR